MAIERITVSSLYVMIWLIQNFYCQAGFCGPRKPVVEICTDDTSRMLTNANIDTTKAPKFQQNTCKCILSTTRGSALFYLNYYRKPSANMEFTIKNVSLDKDLRDGTKMYLMGDTDLLFTTAEFVSDGACLIVSITDKVSKFNVTCTTGTTKVTTGPSTSTSMKDVAGSETFIFSTSTEIINDLTEQQQVETKDEKTSIFTTSTEIITDLTEQQQVETEDKKPSIFSTSTEIITDLTEQQQMETEDEKTSIISTSTEIITDFTEQQQVETEDEKTSILSTSTEVITDFTEQQQVETEDEKTSIISTSTEIITDLTEQHLKTEENVKDKSFIIPVVVSVSGFVCLVIVVAGILYRRKIVSCRRVSTPRNSKAETRNENDYYMTENPMYNMTDTPKNTHVSENEYSFVEDENQEDGITSNQYESLPDSPVGTWISSKPSGQDQEYDYTVCSSASRKYKTAVQKQNKTEVKQGKSLPNDKTNIDETVYDRTDVVAKQFSSFNEYSHLPNTVSKTTADDTYNTLGNSNET